MTLSRSSDHTLPNATNSLKPEQPLRPQALRRCVE
jgi:hypothetical protein